MYLESGAGLVGVDAAGWKRICNSFKNLPHFCFSITLAAKKCYTTYVNPDQARDYLRLCAHAYTVKYTSCFVDIHCDMRVGLL